MAYIERETALKIIDSYANTVAEDGKVIVDAIRDIVAVITPTAYVAEVKHGHWIKTGNKKKCSVCDFFYFSNKDDWNGCPMCFAKMDGKEKVLNNTDHSVDVNKMVQNQWISVDDRLPEEDTRVLVYLVSKRSYTEIDTDRMTCGKWVRWGSDVTHWMPLPEPPKGE